MAHFMKLFFLVVSFSCIGFAKTELTIKKFRFRHHNDSKFERMVVEFSGPSVNVPVEIKTNKATSRERDLSLSMSDVQLVGAIPESEINESFQTKREWSGPLSFVVDTPKNGFSIRTLLKGNEKELDAFWLSEPTRLVIDVYPKTSPRAGNREALKVSRAVASVKDGNAKMSPKKKAHSLSDSIFCFPANSQLDAAIAFEPYKGTSAVKVDVAKPGEPLSDKQKEGIVCYPAHTRVHPQVSFDPSMQKAPSEMASPEPVAQGELPLLYPVYFPVPSSLLFPILPETQARRTLESQRVLQCDLSNSIPKWIIMHRLHSELHLIERIRALQIPHSFYRLLNRN
ncbi:hypothetical protein EBR78_04870 [bacterium]|nr:hypothetical protein [bacterium]